MGRPSATDRLGSRISASGNHSPERCVQSESDRNRRLCAAKHKSQVGRGTWQCTSHADVTQLPKDSVANASQIITVDRELLLERVSKLPRAKLELVLVGVDILLGR